jgi:membrane-bound inhibitor of C-type lysozyme
LNIYISIDEIQNEIDKINKEIYPTNLHITGFQNIKNNFNYKCGPHSVEIKYLVDSNKFILTKKKNFEKDEHVIYIDKVKDLKESLMAVVLNLIEKAITKEARRSLMWSKANEYEEILTVLNSMTENSSIQEYQNLLITPWLMNKDKSIQERINIEVTKFEIITETCEYLQDRIREELLIKCGKIKKEAEEKLNIHELFENANRAISPFLKIGLNTTFYFEVKKKSLEPEFANFFFNMLLNNKVSTMQDFVKYIEVNLESLYISAIREYFYQLLILNYSFPTSWDTNRMIYRCKEEFKFSITIVNGADNFKVGISDNFDRFLISEQDNYDIMLEGRYKDYKGSVKPQFSHKIMNRYFSLEDVNMIKSLYDYIDSTLNRLKNAL